MKAMIEPTFWNDPDFDDISDVATLATYLYLISNAAVSPTGCYPLSRRTAAYDLRMQIDEVEKHLTALKGKVEYDGETSWVWIKGYFPRQYKATANRNILKSVLRSINELRLSNCPFTKEFDDLNSCLINELLTRNEPVPNGQGLDTGLGLGKDKIQDEDKTAFESFWTVYPRKEGKQKALAAWMKHNCTPLVQEILPSVGRHIRCDQWSKDGGKYIPHPSTWINQHRWEDEPMKSLPASSTKSDRPLTMQEMRLKLEQLQVPWDQKSSDFDWRCSKEGKALKATIKKLRKDIGDF